MQAQIKGTGGGTARPGLDMYIQAAMSACVSTAPVEGGFSVWRQRKDKHSKRANDEKVGHQIVPMQLPPIAHDPQGDSGLIM